MRPRSRTRRVLKWVGTALCMSIMALLFLSGEYHISLRTRWEYGVEFLFGSIIIHWPHKDMPALPPERILMAQAPRLLGPYDVRKLFSWPGYWPPRYYGPQPMRSSIRSFSTGSLAVPCWMLFLVVAAPTAYLWWSGRGIPTGQCRKCGYNLTGNVSGRCPECGAVVPAGTIQRVWSAE